MPRTRYSESVKTFERKTKQYLWIFAIALALVFAAMRATGLLGPKGLRWLLPLGFVLMALAPYLLLDAAGRRDIGLRLPKGARIYGVALLLGGAAAFGCFALGYALFGAGTDNWFVSIANDYRQIMDTAGWPVARLHLVFTIPALTLQPHRRRDLLPRLPAVRTGAAIQRPHQHDRRMRGFRCRAPRHHGRC